MCTDEGREPIHLHGQATRRSKLIQAPLEIPRRAQPGILGRTRSLLDELNEVELELGHALGHRHEGPRAHLDAQHLLLGRDVERLTAEQLEEDGAEREEVGPGIHRLSARLLRRGVASHRHRTASLVLVAVEEARVPKTDELDRAFSREQDLLRAQVSMHDPKRRAVR